MGKAEETINLLQLMADKGVVLDSEIKNTIMTSLCHSSLGKDIVGLLPNFASEKSNLLQLLKLSASVTHLKIIYSFFPVSFSSQVGNRCSGSKIGFLNDGTQFCCLIHAQDIEYEEPIEVKKKFKEQQEVTHEAIENSRKYFLDANMGMIQFGTKKIEGTKRMDFVFSRFWRCSRC
ncbi:conserved hypothetical protein [Ricinus communis]|uniref:Uncharacterized protein n=1 Tax=Ricinus communis TaxID=3988 RepID=B9SJ85_RICCO|nr:conserved hypothetical protein [Ricinus communis]